MPSLSQVPHRPAVSMQTTANSSASMLDFPSSDSHLSVGSPDARYQRAQYLPFRRISLPSAPNLNRQSIVSTASFDSLPEEGRSSALSYHSPVSAVSRSPIRASRNRPSSLDVRRPARKGQIRPVDEQREAKRRKVINEFYETERSYLDGLELIYSHFLTPIVASLDTSHPLLDRSELLAIFSNFIDIWNLHRALYNSLTAYCDASEATDAAEPCTPLSPVLLSHFPYLSLYTPFVTSFPDTLASYASLLSSNQAFASFIARQEADPRCGKLKFRDWLLTIVQRCPRYLLLLKDLINCTDPEDPECTQLTAVHALVSKITSSLNTSLHTHAQTLQLLQLQRNTANLPFRLITPGRTFLRRAPLLQLESSTPKEREFLLFSDCLVWLASADGDVLSDKWEAAVGARVPVVRTRSGSEAEPRAADAQKRKESVLKLKLGVSPRKKTRHASGGEERWLYRGHVSLVDLEVVVSASCEQGEEQRFELMSPQQSFAVYAASEAERDEWTTAIRNAKESLLVSLNVTQPNSTLTSSSSTNHLRRTLQALPYPPEEDVQKPKRRRVEHFVPAIWVPDGKAQSCMRCGRTFGWRRRRHHCRLCGRCVCSGCSGKTFFILDSNAREQQKAARACDACYDTVFPVIQSSLRTPGGTVNGTIHSHLTLSGLQSMPTLAFPEAQSSPSALMAIGLESPRRSVVRLEDAPSPSHGGPSVSAIRAKSASRPRSYIQILEDFHDHESGEPVLSSSPSAWRHSVRFSDGAEAVPNELDEESVADDASSRASSSLPPSPKKENTARRHGRFSLPAAVALHTGAVTARQNVVGEGRARRFSLVLGRGGGHADGGKGAGADGGGIAAGRLSELLARVKA